MTIIQLGPEAVFGKVKEEPALYLLYMCSFYYCLYYCGGGLYEFAFSERGSSYGDQDGIASRIMMGEPLLLVPDVLVMYQ